MTVPLALAGQTRGASVLSSPQIRFVRCVGPVVLRSQLARDIACLQDVDTAVSAWSCRSVTLRRGYDTHKPDLVVERENDILVIDVIARNPPLDWVSDAAKDEGYVYSVMSRGDVDPINLRNARDLLRYSGTTVSLEDRIRLLAGLDEHGSLTVAECINAFRETRPIAGLASLILERFVEVDLDTLIGPETRVRRHG